MTLRDVTTSSLVPRDELTTPDLESMLALLGGHFEGVTPAQFAADLAEKNWVLLIRRGGRVVGFTTLLVYESEFRGEALSVVYSGDTIMSPEAWGSTALARGWIAAVVELRKRYPKGKYYWLLLTSGYRTYRFLPVFWRWFHPHAEGPMPSDVRKLRDHLATERFGARFDVGAGIVRLAAPQPLRDTLRAVPEGRAEDAHVAFFLQKNPGHGAGDELVCLTELCPENLTPAGRRMVSGIRDETWSGSC